MFGKKHNEATKAKMRKKRNNTMKMSISAKKRALGEDRVGVNNPAFKGLVKTPYGTFTSLKEAASVENVHYTTIAWRISHDKPFYERVCA